jgi:hypothetical protein
MRLSAAVPESRIGPNSPTAAPETVEAMALSRLQSEIAAELDAMLPSILDKAFEGGL